MSSSASVKLRYEKCLQVWGNATKGYEGLTKSQLANLIAQKHLLEICHDDEKKV